MGSGCSAIQASKLNCSLGWGVSPVAGVSLAGVCGLSDISSNSSHNTTLHNVCQGLAQEGAEQAPEIRALVLPAAFDAPLQCLPTVRRQADGNGALLVGRLTLCLPLCTAFGGCLVGTGLHAG